MASKAMYWMAGLDDLSRIKECQRTVGYKEESDVSPGIKQDIIHTDAINREGMVVIRRQIFLRFRVRPYAGIVCKLPYTLLKS